MKYLLTFCLISFSLLLMHCNPKESKVEDLQNTENVEQKIEELISEMTIEEKVNMIHASSAFTSGGVDRLGIPELVTSDGPHGVRHEHGRDWVKDEGVYDSSTYLPTGISLAATWNKDLGYEFGKVLGSEANFRGKDIILGPGFNLIRTPLNGRNFEYLSEDPYMNSRMVVGYIKGVQEMGVAACAKHYIANTMEFEREKVNVEMSDRALREIYLPPYEAAIKEADVLTIMAAYNKFRGTYVAHSTYLLNEVLKEELGFQGAVISDWYAVKGTDAVYAGIDIEFGTDLKIGTEDYGKFFMGDTVVTMVKEGLVDESIIDEKVRRILRVMFAIKKFGGRQPGYYNTVEHQQVARAVADEAIVLLKNESILPLKREEVKSVALVGANATWEHAGAGGSSQVKSYYEITPMEGLQNLLGEEVEIIHAQGYYIKKEGEGMKLSGEAMQNETAGAEEASNSQDKSADELISEAVNAVKNADAAIYIGGWIHGYSDDWNDNAYDAEAVDKPSMTLPFGQDALIKAVLEANPNTVVVLFAGGPTDMEPWIKEAKAIIHNGYPGMEGGNALASILFGEVNPSGKLPMTFPKKLEDSPAHSVAVPPTPDNLLIDHTEGIFVGYRHFDTRNIEPLFPFGHGLSYTTFDYSNLNVRNEDGSVNVEFQITNSGSIPGKETVQIYVRDVKSSVERPLKELKGFEKVSLQADESTTISVTLDPAAFKFYDETKGEWVLEPGQFEILVGSSSRDIRLTGQIVL